MTKRLFISRNPYRFSDAFRLFRTLRKAQPFHPSPAGGRGQGEGGSSLRLRKTARAVAISPAFSVFFLLISSCGYFDHTESVSPASSPDGGSGDQGGASGNESTNSVSEGDGAVVQISGGNSGASGNAGEISNVSGGGSATTGSTGAGGSSSSSGGAPTGNIGGADASGNDRGGAGGSEGQDAGESDSASEKCTDNDDCSPNVCDLISGVCTECLADGTGCQGNKKLCKPGSTAAENMCVECLTHDNCPGNACDFTRYVCVPCVIENGSPIGCSDDSGKPQCKVDENAPDKNACVECTERAHCSGNTPICDANACRGCKKHDECDYAGGVCKWDTGGCLSDTAVIYVDKGNTTATCNEYRLSSGTKNVPYCVLQSAINAVTSTSRNTVLAYSATYDRITVSNKSVPVLIVGRGAVIAPSSNNETNVYIDGASNVTLEGLTIRDAGGSSNGYGIRCVGTENSPTLTVRRSTITNNANGGVVADNCANVTLDSNTITANAGGGVSLNTSGFEVTAKSAQRGLLPISVLTKRGDVVLDSY
jgi:hypothetical protein